MAMENSHDNGNKPPVSRIVIEFAGPGMADIKRADFENVSLGQMLILRSYMEWQVGRAIGRYEAAQAQKAKLGKIIVPQGLAS